MALSLLLRRAAAAQANEIRRHLRAALLALVLMLTAALVLIFGLAVLMLGAYQSLAVTLPSWQAGALVALGAIALCLILLLLAFSGQRRPRGGSGRRSSPDGARDDAAEAGAFQERGRRPRTAEHAAVDLGSAAGEMIRRHRPSGVELGIAALVAGLVASQVSRRD